MFPLQRAFGARATTRLASSPGVLHSTSRVPSRGFSEATTRQFLAFAQRPAAPLQHASHGHQQAHHHQHSMECRCFSDTPKEKVIPPPMKLDPALDEVIANNKAWVKQMLSVDPKFFVNRAEAPQKPRYLFIGCSDSRVPAELLTGLKPGELFVHRNVGALVVGTDLNCLSVVQYAVEVLEVDHVIVCGHFGCGAIQAAVKAQDLGLIDNWLRNIRDVHRLHFDDMKGLEGWERHTRLVELVTAEQCLNLYKTGIIQQARIKRKGFPHVHGVVYDMHDGLLKPLRLSLQDYVLAYRNIYKLFEDPAFVGDS